MMRRALVGLALVPLLGPALFLGALALADTLAGEGLFLYQLTYEKRLLLTQTIGDFVAALPAAYVLAALLAGLGAAVHRVLGSRWLRAANCIAGSLAGLGLGAFLADTPWDPGAIALALAGCLYATAVTLPLGQVLQARAVARGEA